MLIAETLFFLQIGYLKFRILTTCDQLINQNKEFVLMKLYTLILILLISCCAKEADKYTIADESSVRTIYLDENTDELIKWAVNDLADDLEKMTSKKIILITTDKFKPENKGIYIGMLSDDLIGSLPELYNQHLENQWEKFIIKQYDENLFLVGSDIRGAVYAVFELAEQIGISPWKWWADVISPQKESITLKLPEGGIEEGPSVQYRGIFLNDEDWGLQPWAAKTFEPETGDIGPKTYEKIFQLLLRLKANTIWPAMHPSTKAFFRIPGNREMAEKYHIVVGTSHAEPMLRNNVDEWDKEEYGDFNYFTNSQKVKEYWQERIQKTKKGDNIITLGMRGVHDSGMEGNATMNEKVELLEQIITEQREMLSKIMNKPLKEIPQVVTLYKEVLDLYNNGLKVPDDVTLMWTDDNYGYIRRLSNKTEQEREGGSGVYYHLSYWGRPHDYLWLSTTQPGLIWYEMSKAYQNSAQKIWIANVGDIKPAEYNMEFFLDLAWDIHSITETTINKHLTDWCTREFGNQSSEEISDILQEYYRLAFLRKPEFMGWSQTEPSTATRITEFSTNPDNNEVRRRIDAYSELIKKVDLIKSTIPEGRLDAYFQLIEYPIKGAALMNHKFLYAQQSFLATDSVEKEKSANLSENAYDQISTLTTKYNNDISGGKWQQMMSMKPRNLAAYAMPEYHLSDTPALKHPIVNNKISRIAIQANDYVKAENSENYEWKAIEGLGYSGSGITLFPFDNHSFTAREPYLEYNFKIDKAGNYKVEIRCLPTHANNYDHIVSVEVNGKDRKAFSINTKGRSEAWKINVLRNYVSVTYPVTFEKPGIQIVRIYVNQTGIVLDQIAVDPKNSPDYYEIVN